MGADRVIGGLLAAAEACSENSQCAGFNSHGQLKDASGPPYLSVVSPPGFCFFEKAAGNCEYSIFSLFNECFLKSSPFKGSNGQNRLSNYFAQVCLKRSNTVTRSADPGCMVGVDIRGYDKAVVYATRSREECRLACDNDPGCQFSVRQLDGDCYLKSEPFSSTYGNNNHNSSEVDQLCLKRGTDRGCLSGIDWRGDTLYTFNTTSTEACRTECDGNTK
ncbi:hypothetical protein GPECTOR_48g433 [Gonium pectorale]|uniref:Apple domain-containing protein n=1 Tax=Gonium pectorale TaxID=33097 RepID=A0A150G869_GONPE|nr:hypothetical protein GPECTOR_48g433 [Gonium pectorale]|eukprot:KXZ46001.1 hypothetical protein GPECTOR_48g433 [Gonium pectorale]